MPELSIETLVNITRILDGDVVSVQDSGRWAAAFYLRQIPEEKWPLLRTWAEQFHLAILDTIRIKAVDLAREDKITAMQESIRTSLERDIRGRDYRFTPPQERKATAPVSMEDLLA